MNYNPSVRRCNRESGHETKRGDFKTNKQYIRSEDFECLTRVTNHHFVQFTVIKYTSIESRAGLTAIFHYRVGRGISNENWSKYLDVNTKITVRYFAIFNTNEIQMPEFTTSFIKSQCCMLISDFLECLKCSWI